MEIMAHPIATCVSGNSWGLFPGSCHVLSLDEEWLLCEKDRRYGAIKLFHMDVLQGSQVLTVTPWWSVLAASSVVSVIMLVALVHTLFRSDVLVWSSFLVEMACIAVSALLILLSSKNLSGIVFINKDNRKTTFIGGKYLELVEFRNRVVGEMVRRGVEPSQEYSDELPWMEDAHWTCKAWWAIKKWLRLVP